MSSHPSPGRTPTFVIVGERRAGTSTLAKWMEAHPHIYLYPKLDQAFFLDDTLRGRKKWLDGHIDLAQWGRDHALEDYERVFAAATPSHVAVGEKSADYLFWAPALERLVTGYPDIKIVVCLRHPVQRAWSHYWNEVGKNREWLSFEDAIQAEPGRIQSSDYARVHLSYVERGKYSESLKRLFKSVPRSRVHVVLLDDLVREPESRLGRVYAFLGVAEGLGLERAGVRYNNSWTTVPRPFWTQSELRENVERTINAGIKRAAKAVFRDNYTNRRVTPILERLTRVVPVGTSIDEETKARLLAVYRPYTQELEELLDTSLARWYE